MSRRPTAIALILTAAGLAAWAAFTGATGRREVSARASAPQSQLVFDDEFNGSSLDGQLWNTCYWWANQGCTNESTGELEWYLPGQVTVAQGAAQLTAARRTVRGSDGRVHKFVSGMITTGPAADGGPSKFAFLYGKLEARIKVPAGQGLWPTFWLLPANESSLPEIDAMEILGQSPDQVHLHLHYTSRGRVYDEGVVRQLNPTQGGWHVYEVDWEPGQLTWSIDGQTMFSITGSAVPHVKMYVLVNLAVGGHYAGPPNASTPFPSTVQVDWVRVWQ
jgi:beta-glucanase (GH16 family)